MTRSAAAPAAAKTISTKVGPPWCTGAGGELPPPPVPLDECSGGGWVLAGESGAPWDLAGAGGGGGEESLCPDGAGEDEAVGGGDDESADGGGAVEGEGLLFAGDGAAGGLVEELDDMARHDTINLRTLSLSRPCGRARRSPAGGRRGGGGGSRRSVAAPPLPLPSAHDATPTPSSSGGSGPARPLPGHAHVRAFHPPRRHLTRGEK